MRTGFQRAKFCSVWTSLLARGISLLTGVCLSLSATPAFAYDLLTGDAASDRLVTGSFSVPGWYSPTASKTGAYTPPQVIYPQNSTFSSSTTGTLPGTLYSTPYSGWGGWGYSNPATYGVVGAIPSIGGWGFSNPATYGIAGAIPSLGGWGGYGGWGFSNPVTYGVAGAIPSLGGWGGWGGRGWGGLGGLGSLGGWGGLGGLGGGIPYIGSIGSIGSFSRGYGSWGGWGGGWGNWYNPAGSALFMGAFGNSIGNNNRGRITEQESVIQLGPSKASGNYYEPATKDPSASGNYYASDPPPANIPIKPITNAPSYWSDDKNPFGNDLNKTPW